MRIRRHLIRYRRDSYLTEGAPDADDGGQRPIIDCSLGYNPMGYSRRAEEAIRAVDFAQMAAYPEMFYSTLLKPVILKKFAGSGLSEDNVFFGHGSFNIAERLIHKLIEPAAMLGYGPQFNEIPSEMVAAGGSYRPLPMGEDFRFPKEAMIGALQEDSYSVVYVDNPNNPTGQLIDLGDLADIAEVAERKGTITLVDEAYGDFVDDRHSCFNLVREYENVVVIRSLSKALGLAGMRVGYAAMSDSLARVYREVDVPFEPGLLSALAAKATLEDVEFIAETRRAIKMVKQILTDGLKRIGIAVLPTHEQVSIFVAHVPGRNLFRLFASQGIRTEAGSAYRLTFEAFDDSFVRLRVPASEEMVGEILKRVGCAMGKGPEP